MVDVSGKEETQREAAAIGRIYVAEKTLERIASDTIAKGDVLAAARFAAFAGTKKTWELIPLCHSLPLTQVAVDITLHAPEMENLAGGSGTENNKKKKKSYVEVCCTAKAVARTGVEMEALMGVQLALLTIYDMCKAIDKKMHIGDVHLVRKLGGKSGDFFWNEEDDD